jgi:hypothetical protein
MSNLGVDFAAVRSLNKVHPVIYHIVKCCDTCLCHPKHLAISGLKGQASPKLFSVDLPLSTP